MAKAKTTPKPRFPKEGAIVTIQNRAWYEKNKDAHGNVAGRDGYDFTEAMAAYCGKKTKVTSLGHHFCDGSKYARIGADNGDYYWVPEFFKPAATKKAPISAPKTAKK